MPRASAVIGLLFLCSCVLGSNTATERFPGDGQLERLRDTHGVDTLGVGVLRAGKLVWSCFCGEQSPGVLANEHSMFNAASVAKAITTEVVLRLVERGQLDLDECLSDHWLDPDIATDQRHMLLTPRLVLTHRTGFPNWRYLTDDQLCFQSDPGATFGYSGEGFEYLRRAVEAKLGRQLQDVAQELVFDPLAMRGTTFVDREQVRMHLVRPRSEHGEWQSPNAHAPGDANAADDLFITVHDYAVLLGSLWRDGATRSSLHGEKMTIQSDIRDDPSWRLPASAPRQPTCCGFGLGWLVFEWETDRLVWHGGNDATEHAIGYINPDTGDGVIVLTNGANGLGLMLDVLDLVDNRPAIAAFYRALLNAEHH